MGRLTREAAAEVSAPGVTPARSHPESVGHLHLGFGAFHRAHQGLYTERAMALSGDRSWGVLGVTGRRPDVARTMAEQGGAYGVLVRHPDGDRLDLVDAVLDVLAAEQEDAIADALADERTRVVTLTITEQAYADPATSIPLRRLAAGLARRHERSRAPLSVISCDNLSDNGRVLRDAVGRLLEPGSALASWVADTVAFPSSMVDRIVPATTPADVEAAAALSGLVDHGLVVAEPFSQWVVQDDLVAGHPGWDRVGVQLVPDVAGWEQLKLRVLNTSHSLLAWQGALAGHDTISSAAADPALHQQVVALMDEVATVLQPPPGADVPGYRAEVLRRFANPMIRHTTAQVARDGSRKLPERVFGTMRDQLAAGLRPEWTARLVGLWLAYLARFRDPSSDPLAPEVLALLDEGPDEVTVVRRVCRLIAPAAEDVLQDEVVTVMADALREASSNARRATS
ncbi:mannitol dehydrogenase family protein [Desertihabitans brevis]|uniref:Mannitol-1-phosphate 5-dehydrogenase n=1 Tax=Desertihabitans brevis TaxID=2268447 RepID=A0A367YXA7_9ACTN|nr:mannitol dehydrogenase family protein [Desertihabitans brevis]RCK70149.1 mannitol dehydrogenase family protein [Desertihabitans brevis]